MLYKSRRVARKQTRPVACGDDAPSVAVFNEALMFDIEPRQSLPDISVELTLVDCHRVTRDEYLGKLVVSPFDHTQWGTDHTGVTTPHGGHRGCSNVSPWS